MSPNRGPSLTTLQDAEIATARLGLGANGSGEASAFSMRLVVATQKLHPPFGSRKLGSDIGSW